MRETTPKLEKKIRLRHIQGLLRVKRLAAPLLVLALALGAGGVALAADANERTQMRSLDEQVQEIKSEVLSIAAELSLLEEKLLYPSDTQVAVFVSLAEGTDLVPDSVEIRIDGEFVTHHIYSFKEVEALKKGGVQRIYTGNVTAGPHNLEVTAAGKLPGGRDFSRDEARPFTKNVEPALLRVTLASDDFGNADVEIGGVVVQMARRPNPMRLLALCLVLVSTESAAKGVEVVDPYFGEALYEAYQERYFDALERLDTEIALHRGVDEPQLDPFHHHIKNAEFDVGDFELNYRMHHRAGRAIRAVLEGDVDEAVRNEAAFRLARIHFQKDQLDEAMQALDGIHGRVPESIRDDIEFLRANVYMAIGRPHDAVVVLEALGSARELRGFSDYNLGIALLRDGQQEDAIRQLERAGRISASSQPELAIRDKSNLLLGTLLFEASQFDRAQRSLDRVRMAGPFSNQALLRAGWADLSGERYERALAPWTILARREPTDPAVQEALLALPYAYSKLDVHGRAAHLYGQAIQSFGAEIEKVDASIDSIRNGDFLAALVREEIKQDKDWVIKLRSLPDAPETFYLVDLMASHDFQTALQNYLDLEDLRRRLAAWQRSFAAYENIVELRRAYYEPLLPKIDDRFRGLDAEMRLRLEQRRHLERRLHEMLTSPRPEHLATAEEQQVASRLQMLVGAYEEAEGSEPHLARIAKLRGVLTWSLETSYHERLTTAHGHLEELNDAIEGLTAQYDAFVRTRQAAAHSYVGYDIPITRLRARVSSALDQLGALMARQGHMLETVAIAELASRRERLEAYQGQAQFAFADSYDRAAKAQGR